MAATGESSERITSGFVRSHFQWDFMNEVDWSLVRNNLASANRVLANPEKFPRADFDYLEEQTLELEMFLLNAPLTLNATGKFYLLIERFQGAPHICEQTMCLSIDDAVERAKGCDTAFEVLAIDREARTAIDATADVLKKIAAESSDHKDGPRTLHYELAGLCDFYRIDHYQPRRRTWGDVADDARANAA